MGEDRSAKSSRYSLLGNTHTTALYREMRAGLDRL